MRRRRKRSLPMRGEWIEMLFNRKANATRSSLPMRGEWIEIIRAKIDLYDKIVSPHAGRVD